MATAEFEVRAVGFRDSEGILRAEIISNFSDVIFLDGWFGHDTIEFESEAHHLRGWCDRRNLPYFESAPFEFELELEEQ